MVQIPNYPQRVGASSTVGAIVVTQCIASETALKLQKAGHEMFIFVSPNVTECPPDYMHQVYANYTKLVRENKN